MKHLVAMILVAGCAGGSANGVFPDGGSGANDAGATCMVSLAYDPDPAIVGLGVNVTATVVDGAGVPMWKWHVFAPGGAELTPTPESTDGGRIGFTPSATGTYEVTADPQLGLFCSQGQQQIQVQSATGGAGAYFVRFLPPSTSVPPQATFVQLHAATPVDQPFALQTGVVVAGSVVAGGSGVPAYVRFTPTDGSGAIVETFAGSAGQLSVRLLAENYDALVVPEVPNLAPRVFAAWSPLSAPPLALDAGATVTGTVKDGSGAALAGAKVQLASGALPSTLATTDATGAFTIHEAFTTAAVDVVVTPPAGRGLPALAASATLDLSKPTQTMQIQFASLATCDVAGTHVRYAGTAAAGATVALVGSVAAAGTITTVTGSTTAAGAVHATATTDAAGALPSTLVPRAALEAVVEASPGASVVALDASACAAPTLDAPAMIAQAGTVLDAAGTHAVAGARLEATPTAQSPLALAGAPPVAAAAAADGTFTLGLVAGASYDLRLVDPAARSAARVVAGFTPSATAVTEMLAPAVALAGTVTANGNPQAGAAVQVLCATCTGLDASRPVAEGSTDATGRFQLAVPDPGSM